MSNVQGGGVLVKNPVSAPGPPPPFKNPGSAPGHPGPLQEPPPPLLQILDPPLGVSTCLPPSLINYVQYRCTVPLMCRFHALYHGDVPLFTLRNIKGISRWNNNTFPGSECHGSGL